MNIVSKCLKLVTNLWWGEIRLTYLIQIVHTQTGCHTHTWTHTHTHNLNMERESSERERERLIYLKIKYLAGIIGREYGIFIFARVR